MALATDTWAAACRWCSPRIASSAVVSLRREVLLDRGADRREPQAVLADAMQQLDDEGDVEAPAAAVARVRRASRSIRAT